MDSLSAVSALSMDTPGHFRRVRIAWAVRGVFVDSLRTFRRQSVGVHGQSVDSSWISHGQSWPVCGVVMGRCAWTGPWGVCGHFMDNPRAVHRQSVESP